MRQTTRQSLRPCGVHAITPTTAITTIDMTPSTRSTATDASGLAAGRRLARQPVGARRVGADAGRQEAADERADQEQSRRVAGR